MNDLVIDYNNTLVTTQENISVLTANNEQSIQKLIRTYKQDIEEFGELIFQNIQVQAGLGFTYKKVYFLNEQQATLILAYMKNSQQVRDAKKILVKAFFEMKKQVENNSSNNDLQKILNQIETQNQEIQNLKNQLALQEPQKPINPFRGFYDNFAPRERENEFAYSRKDWMLLLSECERVLIEERKNKRQLLLSRGGAL